MGRVRKRYEEYKIFMARILEKVERRLGEKLFLKGDRCIGPKCAAARRNYVPGVHGKQRRRRRESSEYGVLLKEKQKIRFQYGLDDGDVKRYSKKAAAQAGIFSENLMRMLESRLDTVVFRCGFSPSRRAARQMIVHGHVRINQKTVKIPSYEIRNGERITLKESSWKAFEGLDARFKKQQLPSWLASNPDTREAQVIGKPEAQESSVMIDTTKIKEFYSR